MRYQLLAEVRSTATEWEPYSATVARAPSAPTARAATEDIRRDAAYALGVSELHIEVRHVIVRTASGGSDPGRRREPPEP